ncbi:histidine kinase [Fusobacterium polymorphum]|uniref:Histidine kinase n=1 Tax=Fusobacterium nucleatum subsp. polymorphum TaxID=76857 RepID=A0A1Z3CEN7_FUSNP|nr:histidine kinase [Fusobacterium polymorphum]
MNNTNIENVVLKFVILLILVYNIFKTLTTEYMRLRLVISSLVKYSLFCIVVFKYNIQIKSSSVDIMSYLVVAIVD